MFKFIPTASTGVRQTFGKFSNLCTPGLNFYIPFVQKISPVSNMVVNKEFGLKVKTKDNVFTTLNIGVQLQIKSEDTATAFFSLDNPDEQISTYIQNVVRSKVPTMKLDEFIELFAAEFDETPADQFTPETIFKDLEEWDSLTSLSVIAVIDEELEKRIVSADFRNSNTIEELYEIVQNK